MINNLLRRRDFIAREMKKCEATIRKAPPGKLEIHKNRESLRWRIVNDDRSRKNLPKKEICIAKKYAEKRIASDYLTLLKKELHAIDYCLKHIPNNSDYEKFNLEKSRYSQILNDQKTEQLPWHLQEYKTNHTHKENLVHTSPSGHVLRSKSECLIDMLLFYRGIPFRYESVLNLENHEIYPDFTFYNEKTDEYRYWEHFGMMDDSKYRKKAMMKIEQYIRGGFIPNENLYLTFETSKHPITATTIGKIIDDIWKWLQ